MLKGAEEEEEEEFWKQQPLGASIAGGMQQPLLKGFLCLPALPTHNIMDPRFKATIRYGGVKINVIYKVGS